MQSIDSNFRTNCQSCFLCSSKCICGFIKTIQSDFQIIILQHLRERHKSIGTEKIVRLSIPNTITISSYRFQHNPLLNEILNDKDRKGYLLYPAKEAVSADKINTATFKNKFLVVLDGTWSHAQNIYQSCEGLKMLEPITLANNYRSNYRIRTQPNTNCLSTVEAVAHCLESLENSKGKYKPLLNVFDKMIDAQCDEIPNENLINRKRFKKVLTNE